ncbi:multiheme c-type cytochrome, partial [Campylobacter jejuni]|uniref:multiheme c-type cytochrome n=1 Tax=Campylobacter jejuni TaxID=197 RepID=UPI002F96877B
PMFKYEKEGRIVGKYAISDREEEYVEFSNGPTFAQQNNLAHTSVTYRVGRESILDFPNKFVGPKKCGECHPAQYKAWERSRHAKTV